MSFCIDNEKLLEKYKTTQAKIEDLKIIELNALPVYHNTYIKTKIRTYVDKVYAFVALMCQKIIQNVNLLQSFILTLCLYTKTDIICKYIQTIMLIKLQTNK